MKNKNANLFILICAILTFMFSSYADQDEEHLINKAREHIREHSVIDNTIIDEMTASIEYQFGYPHIVAFQYFSFSEPILSVSFNRNCDIVYCTCTELTTEEYQKDLDYVRNMKEAALATIEWENRYGPCELWEVDINAEFYERYHYHPKETQQFYEHSISNGCGFNLSILAILSC